MIKRFIFDYLFNCAGLHADKVAKLFDLASNYKLMPFKGQYLKLKENFNARNPATNELIYKPERIKIRFRPAKKLKIIINE